MEKIIKSKNRVRDHGEVFTPQRLVNDMLDLLPQSTFEPNKTFLEPACGTGNFLIEILIRKLNCIKDNYRINFFTAVSSIYGIDIQKDNVIESRLRLFDYFVVEYQKKESIDAFYLSDIALIIEKNIMIGDMLTQKNEKDDFLIFSEWSIDNGYMIQKGYTLDGMVENKIDKITVKKIKWKNG